MDGSRTILIDTDIAFGSANADPDDVLAIMLAFSLPRLDIAAITPVGGNVSPEEVSANLHRFLARTGRSGIPHAWSAALPLDPELRVKSERWDKAPPEAIEKPADAPRMDSVDLIIKSVAESPGPLTIVAIGPLTNLGRALEREPGIAARIEEIVMMGGSRRVRGLNGLAEFNIRADPAAAAIVFDSGVPMRVFGLDVTKKRKVLPQDIDRWDDPASPLVRDVRESVLGFMRLKGEMFGPEYFVGYFHDAFPIAYFPDPGLFTFETCRIRIGLDGAARGVTDIDFGPAAGAQAGGPHRFAVDVDDAALMEYVIDTIASFWKGAG